jgi:eukaryotic-like serine/threonine-protein kinase
MSASAFKFGDGLSRYHIHEQIGAGGIGVVFRAYDEELRRDVALKFLHADPEDDKARSSLLHEAQIAASLNHPNICTIYEVGQKSGQAYIAMEHVAGKSLSSLLEDGPLPLETVIHYGMQMADALAYAHDHGVIHRDFKSSNVAVTPELRLKVLDFGLARRHGTPHPEGATETLTQEPVVQGTLLYAAPEILSRMMPDSRSDIWSLGVVLYEMAAGRSPFFGATVAEICTAILRDPPDMTPVRSAGLAAIITRCLRKDPAQRYQRASEVFAALQTLASTGNLVVGEPDVAEPSHSRRLLWIAAPLLIVILAAGAYFFSTKASTTTQFDSIAVLPLANLSGDAEQEYLVDGMTDILITNLAKIKAFRRVISRNSVVRYKNLDNKTHLSDVARALNVDVLLTGSVMRQKDRVRITLQLVDPIADRVVWAEDYEGSLANIINLEGQIALTVAQQVKLTLTPQERQSLVSKNHPTDASVAYLKGLYYWNKRGLADLEKSRQYFEEAISLDPGYALAYSGLADYYIVRMNQGLREPAKARAAALKALELNPDLSEAHAGLGLLGLMDGYDSNVAEAELLQAIAMNPNYATAHQWYAIVLTFNGRIREALSEAKRAQELDPLSMTINSYLGYCLYLNRQNSEGGQQFQKTLELDRNFAIAHYFYARLLVATGDLDGAISHAERAAALAPDIPAMSATLAYAYAAAGNEGKARQVIAELGRSKQKPLPGEAAFAYARLNDVTSTLAALEKSEQQGTLWSVSMPSEPALDSVRSDPQFEELWSRVSGRR